VKSASRAKTSHSGTPNPHNWSLDANPGTGTLQLWAKKSCPRTKGAKFWPDSTLTQRSGHQGAVRQPRTTRVTHARQARAHAGACELLGVGAESNSCGHPCPILSESVTSLGCWTPVEGVEPGKLCVTLASKAIYGASAKARRDVSKSILKKAEVV
jgi:hypothetical protein